MNVQIAQDSVGVISRARELIKDLSRNNEVANQKTRTDLANNKPEANKKKLIRTDELQIAVDFLDKAQAAVEDYDKQFNEPKAN